MVTRISFSVCILFFTYSYCTAQVPVSKEPMHHNVFQNEYVRILDVHVKPNDTTLFHKHELPSVFIVLSNAKTGSELISNGATANAPVTYGNIWFEGFYTKPRIHRVWNSDTIEFHVMDIELLKKTFEEIDSPLHEKSVHMLFNENPVRAYSAVLNSKSVIKLKGNKAPILVICLSDSINNVTINGKPFEKKGDFVFVPPAAESAFINNGGVIANVAIFELK